MKIGEYIRSKRKEKLLTLKQLGEKIGLSHTYLSQIELGDRNVSPDMLEKISKALDVPYLDLMAKAGYIDEQIKDTFRKAEEAPVRTYFGKTNEDLNLKKLLETHCGNSTKEDYILDIVEKTKINSNTFDKILAGFENEIEFKNEEVSLIADYLGYPFILIYLITNNRKEMFERLGLPITTRLLSGLASGTKGTLVDLENAMNKVEEAKQNGASLHEDRYEMLTKSYDYLKSIAEFDNQFKSQMLNSRNTLDLNEILEYEDLNYKGIKISKKQRELISNIILEMLN